MISKTDAAKNAVEKTIEWLETGAPHVELTTGLSVDGFDMNEGIGWDDIGCGTTCCIAGALVQFHNPEGTLEKIREESHHCQLTDTFNLPYGEVEKEAYEIIFGENYFAARVAKVLEPLFFADGYFDLDEKDDPIPKIVATMLRDVIDYKDSNAEIDRNGVSNVVEAAIKKHR